MNCSNPTCNIPAAPHELIGGLCHRCTAAACAEKDAGLKRLSDYCEGYFIGASDGEKRVPSPDLVELLAAANDALQDPTKLT